MHPAGAVLDTSFFITLAGKDRAHHAAARDYWRWLIEKGVPLYLPTIVVSEFYLRQELPPEIARACITLPFNWDDAIQCSKFRFPLSDRDPSTPRESLKDDLKIMAQAVVQNAAYLITDDEGFHRTATRLKAEGQSQCISIHLKDGFSEAQLDPTGQGLLFGTWPAPNAETEA